MTVYPWNELDSLGSPFVSTFAKVGVTAAAGIINFVVITAAMSGCNSGIFSAGRMLYTLGVNGQAPKFFTKFSQRRSNLQYARCYDWISNWCYFKLHRST